LATSTRGRVVGPHRLDVDRPENRHRLWSLADTPIEYYLRTFRASREAKRSRIRAMLEGS
jgi:hypothetical protein